ncbi:MAG: CRISPR-associated helicase Cas3' [Betaproteobacteria bacterium]|nr:CRISPR-associated helicase Cas3' [Betaproteobacteria bacterium]
MTYDEFFRQATRSEAIPRGLSPLPYQRRLAEGSWPDLLDIPTGLGKTAAVILAWVWKRRGAKPDPETPRRLVYCLPMRVLVEQTCTNVETWLKNLGLIDNVGNGKVSVHVLMGGEDDTVSWAGHPEEDMILIGTQDMLLSRALMRGYGMSRYQWPVHFALLHNDALWIFDEVQLMGAGLSTSAQIEAFRRARQDMSLGKASGTLWVSATLNKSWLGTVDFEPHLESLCVASLTGEDDKDVSVIKRKHAAKAIAKAHTVLNTENIKAKAEQSYIESLVQEIKKQHVTSTNTLVIVNRVDRAQAIYRALAETGISRFLVHARFRAAEREVLNRKLRDLPPSEGRIIVATQAVEAGVDITSKTLFSELAPWTSLVQRFGRCNRYGEANDSGGGRVFWIAIEEDKALALPYEPEELIAARERLQKLASVSPADLPRAEENEFSGQVLRRKDFVELFNTDSDLSGFDVDISPYIRDTGVPQLQVFWRNFSDNPNDPLQSPPARAELCPVSIGQAQGLTKRAVYLWDSLGRRWSKLGDKVVPRPGMTLLLKASEGGYDAELGFTLEGKEGKAKVDVIAAPGKETTEAYAEDWRSRTSHPVALATHLSDVGREAQALCEAMSEAAYKDAVVSAACWHDVGKAHPVFHATMHACDKAPEGLLAKSPCKGRHSRKYFRHELASMLAWLEHGKKDETHDLIAYLIAAHHGKVRMGLRALPDEEPEKDKAYQGQRFARGIWEGDELPALDFDDEAIPQTRLRLSVMELGEGEQGPSWSARTQRLLKRHGPFMLAWLETLVRLADWRASRKEQEQADKENP